MRTTPADAARALAWHGPDDPGDWTAVTRTFRYWHAETWYAADATLGWWGPDGFTGLVAATADPGTLPGKGTWYLATNLPRPVARASQTARTQAGEQPAHGIRQDHLPLIAENPAQRPTSNRHSAPQDLLSILRNRHALSFPPKSTVVTRVVALVSRPAAGNSPVSLPVAEHAARDWPARFARGAVWWQTAEAVEYVRTMLGIDVNRSELETLASATLKRHRHVRTVAGRLLAR